MAFRPWNRGPTRWISRPCIGRSAEEGRSNVSETLSSRPTAARKSFCLISCSFGVRPCEHQTGRRNRWGRASSGIDQVLGVAHAGKIRRRGHDDLSASSQNLPGPLREDMRQVDDDMPGALASDVEEMVDILLPRCYELVEIRDCRSR